jgi:hypothetical protein
VRATGAAVRVKSLTEHASSRAVRDNFLPMHANFFGRGVVLGRASESLSGGGFF